MTACQYAPLHIGLFIYKILKKKKNQERRFQPPQVNNTMAHVDQKIQQVELFTVAQP